MEKTVLKYLSPSKKVRIGKNEAGNYYLFTQRWYNNVSENKWESEKQKLFSGKNLKKGKNTFDFSDGSEIIINANDRFLTLQSDNVEMDSSCLGGCCRSRRVINKEVYKLYRLYNSDIYGLTITSQWFNYLKELELVKV